VTQGYLATSRDTFFPTHLQNDKRTKRTKRKFETVDTNLGLTKAEVEAVVNLKDLFERSDLKNDPAELVKQLQEVSSRPNLKPKVSVRIQNIIIY
jgi:hypothetical protein